MKKFLKNKFKYILVLLLIIPCLFLLGGCTMEKVVVGIERSDASTAFVTVYTITYSDGSTSSFSVENGKDGADLKIEDIYAAAQESGYTGTFLEFLDDYLDVNGGAGSSEQKTKETLFTSVIITAEFPTKTGNFLQSNIDIAIGSGSGVIYRLDKNNGDAYIITNYHVVYNTETLTNNKISNDIRCYLYGASLARDYVRDGGGNIIRNSEGYPDIEYLGDAIECEYVGGSMQYDIAVLKISDSPILKNSNAQEVKVFNSDNIQVGSDAIAVGNPEGKGFSITKGIVCVDSENLTMKAADEATTVTHRVLRTDAPVNSGNSGGGLYNAYGELIGIVNAKVTDNKIENIGYAIPSIVATRIADNIILNAGSNKTAKKPTIGITISAENSRAVYNEETGEVKIVEDVIIQEVTSGTLADKAGIVVGDKIVSITINGVNGTTYKIDRSYQVVDLCWLFKAGDIVTFEMEGKTTKFNVIIKAEDLKSVA